MSLSPAQISLLESCFTVKRFEGRRYLYEHFLHPRPPKRELCTGLVSLGFLFKVESDPPTKFVYYISAKGVLFLAEMKFFRFTDSVWYL